MFCFCYNVIEHSPIINLLCLSFSIGTIDIPRRLCYNPSRSKICGIGKRLIFEHSLIQFLFCFQKQYNQETPRMYVAESQTALCSTLGHCCFLFYYFIKNDIDFYKPLCYTDIDRARVLGNTILGIPLLRDLCLFYFVK